MAHLGEKAATFARTRTIVKWNETARKKMLQYSLIQPFDLSECPTLGDDKMNLQNAIYFVCVLKIK